MLCLGEDILSQLLTEIHSNNKSETVFQWLIQKHARLRDSKMKRIILLNINPRNMKILYFGGDFKCQTLIK